MKVIRGRRWRRRQNKEIEEGENNIRMAVRMEGVLDTKKEG